MAIVKYEHHGEFVCVRDDLKGKHRQHCLCYAGCARFKPEKPDNCIIAQALYSLCVIHNVTTPVWECPEYFPI